MQEETRRTNRDRSDATRAALVAAARDLFASRSYAETGTPEIVAAAGVTRGALYHHFADKQDLMRAVVEAEQSAVAEEIERGAPAGGDPLAALIAGGRAFLDAMAHPGRARILLLDAPAALGREALDAIDARHGGRTLQDGLRAAMVMGAITDAPVEPLAALLSAAFDRAAGAIAGGAPREPYEAALESLIRGLGTD